VTLDLNTKNTKCTKCFLTIRYTDRRRGLRADPFLNSKGSKEHHAILGALGVSHWLCTVAVQELAQVAGGV
jgi:hypothetical protein